MATLIQEFQNRRGLLDSMHFEESGARLGGFLDWMESDPELMTILNTIRTQSPVGPITERCDEVTPPKASTLEEVASVGVYLMEECRSGHNLYELAMSLGINPQFSSTHLQDYTEAALDRFIRPTLAFIEGRIRDIYQAPTPSSMLAGQLSSSLMTGLMKAHPGTAECLQKVATQLAQTEKDGEWFNVGNSCREALKTFTSELCDMGIIERTGAFRDGDVKNWLKAAVEQRFGNRRFGETLGRLIATVWDHSQAVVHRKSTSKSEALRIFVWTTLSISELADLFTNGTQSSER